MAQPPPTTMDLRAMESDHDRLHAQVAIDKHALDDELATQAVKFRDVCDAAVMTVSYLAAAKDHFDRIEAELTNQVREDHEALMAREPKTPKMTVDAVASAVKVDERWQDAKALRRDWEHMQAKMSALKEVFSQRSSNMKELPVLYAAGYWQSNSSTGAPRGMGERQAEATRRELSERRDLAAAEARAREAEPRRPDVRPAPERRRPLRDR